MKHAIPLTASLCQRYAYLIESLFSSKSFRLHRTEITTKIVRKLSAVGQMIVFNVASCMFDTSEYTFEHSYRTILFLLFGL